MTTQNDNVIPRTVPPKRIERRYRCYRDVGYSGNVAVGRVPLSRLSLTRRVVVDVNTIRDSTCSVICVPPCSFCFRGTSYGELQYCFGIPFCSSAKRSVFPSRNVVLPFLRSWTERRFLVGLYPPVNRWTRSVCTIVLTLFANVFVHHNVFVCLFFILLFRVKYQCCWPVVTG